MLDDLSTGAKGPPVEQKSFEDVVRRLDRLMSSPWMVGDADVPVWQAYVDWVSTAVSREEAFQRLRKHGMHHRSLLSAVLVDEHLRALGPNGLLSFTKSEVYNMACRLEMLGRLEDALSLYSQPLTWGPLQESDIDLIERGQRVARLLDRPQTVAEFRELESRIR